MDGKIAVVAVGGNSLLKSKELKTVEDQYRAICETMASVVELAEQGWRLVLTHGNGPQVGFILRRSEIARQAAGMHHVPLVSCVADTQGAIGYQFQQALGNEFAKRGKPRNIATIVTQVLVDAADPGFDLPDKPIGDFYTEDQLPELLDQHSEWVMMEDAGRGYRRVVPSPKPLGFPELDAVRTLLGGGYHVVAMGGGGIPVTETPEGFVGVDAVVDKDLASALLANQLGAELLVISTAVEQVMLHFGKPDAEALDTITAAQAQAYADEGNFAPGSMLPKIDAALSFLKGGGKRVVITDPAHVARAVDGNTGTHIIP
jgi:carbamate kinase